MHKLLVSAVLCVALSSIVQSESEWGARQLGDERIFYKIVKQKNGFLSKAVEDVDYPEKGTFSTVNITYIEAINQTPKSGSTVTIEKGGVGFPFVKLHFKSTRTSGYNYILQIYGRQNNVQPQPAYPPSQPGYPGRHY